MSCDQCKDEIRHLKEERDIYKGSAQYHTELTAELESVKKAAEEAAWELVHVDASMKERAEKAKAVFDALGVEFPPKPAPAEPGDECDLCGKPADVIALSGDPCCNSCYGSAPKP